MFVGVPLAIDAMCPANVAESSRWPALLDSITEATGEDPEAVVMDRRYSTRPSSSTTPLAALPP